MVRRIETGVDRLVKLITEQKKIDIDQASKMLGVSKLVVTEWAEFLADENLISIDYGLSKTTLRIRELSSSDLDKKAKDLLNKKDALLVGVDTSLQQVQKESDKFLSLKKEFEEIKKTMGTDLKGVKTELAELMKYEKLKEKIDEDIKKEISNYNSHIKQAGAAIEHEQKRLKALTDKIQSDEQKLSDEYRRVNDLHQLERMFIKKTDELIAQIKDTQKRISGDESIIKRLENHLDSLHKDAGNLRKEIDELKKKRLDPLVKERDEHVKRIEEIRDTLLSKVKSLKEKIESDAKGASKAAKKIESFFNKRMKLEKAIDDINKEQSKIASELEDLKKAVLSFHIAVGHKSVVKEYNKLQARFNELEKKRSEHAKNLKGLLQNIFR